MYNLTLRTATGEKGVFFLFELRETGPGGGGLMFSAQVRAAVLLGSARFSL